MIGDWLTPVAWAQDGGGATTSGGNPMTLVVMFGAIGLIWWLMMMRPQQKREKERRSMITALRKGDVVVTVGGIHARIFAVDDDVITCELGRDVRFKLDKNAIVARVGDEAKDAKGKDTKSK
jgi:preprotein translocase subunit YajC